MNAHPTVSVAGNQRDAGSSVPRVAVLGGGISGLTTAWHLREEARSRHRRVEVVLLESGPRVGGNIATDRFDGFTVERGPNGYLDNVAATRELVHGLGLDSEIQRADAAAARRFLYRFGRLHPLPRGPLSFFRSGVLSVRGRLRVALEPFVRSRPGEDDETVFEFARRRIGREAAEVLVDAMVSGVFAGDSTELSLRSTFPAMAAMEEEHGSLVEAMVSRGRKARRERRRGSPTALGGPAGPGGTLTSFRNGLDTLPSALAERLGSAVRLSSEVRSIRPDDGERCWWIGTGGDAGLGADAVLLTVPASRAALLLRSVDEGLASEVAAIETCRLAVVALAFRSDDIGGDPEGFGFLVPRGTGPRILGCLWDSSIFPGRAPQGRVLMRAMVGGRHDPSALDLGDEALLSEVLGDLETVMGVEVPPLWHRIYRYPRAIGQYLVGHRDRLERIEECLAGLPGLYLAGSSYRGVSMNACIEEAAGSAAAILDDLEARSSGSGSS